MGTIGGNRRRNGADVESRVVEGMSANDAAARLGHGRGSASQAGSSGAETDRGREKDQGSLGFDQRPRPCYIVQADM